MRLRPLALLAAPIALALAVGAAPASAAQVVGTDAANNVFANASQTVSLGDSVEFTNSPALFPGAGGPHNVVWDNGGFPGTPNSNIEGSSDPWTFSRTFTKPGLYRFYCKVHGDVGGVGMAGKILVRNADGSLPDITPPSLKSAAATPGRGVATLKFRSTEAGKATGTIKLKGRRGFNKFGDLAFAVKKGSNSIAVRRTKAGKKLGKGAYQLSFSVADAAGNKSAVKTLKFTISR